MENINLGFYSIFVALLSFGITFVVSKSNRYKEYRLDVNSTLGITMGVQWLYVSVFLFVTPDLRDMALGFLVLKLLIPVLAIIPALLSLAFQIIHKIQAASR